MISRRRFLESSLLALLFTAAPRVACSRSRQERILIVGAGMAGLAAARELRRSGFETLVLEARERIGGRIRTDRSLGVPIDLGASWIHGKRGNPMASLARDLKLRCMDTDYDDIVVYDSGRALPEARLEVLEGDWALLEAQLEAFAERAAADTSVARAVESVLRGQPIDEVERRFLNWRLESFVVTAAASLGDLSLLGDEGESFGGGDCLFPGGYGELIDRVAEGTPTHLEHTVTDIELLSDRVRIRAERKRPLANCNPCHLDPRPGAGSTPDSGAETLTFEGDRVIVTLPLGVLQAALAGDGIRFHPPLPDWKREAISGLGIGDLNKVALRFDKPFWPRSRHFLGFLGGTQGGFPVFQNYFRYLKTPVLVGFRGGKGIRDSELRSDREAQRDAMEALRAMFGPGLPDPVGVAVSRWHTDPFSVGAYPHVPVGATSRAFEVLARPVGERLFFAGDATAPDHSGTVHGAYLSGLREAERIARL